MSVVMLSQLIAAGVALPEASLMQLEPNEPRRARRSLTSTSPLESMSEPHASWAFTPCGAQKRCTR
jgi:hypothetical protein